MFYHLNQTIELQACSTEQLKVKVRLHVCYFSLSELKVESWWQCFQCKYSNSSTLVSQICSDAFFSDQGQASMEGWEWIRPQHKSFLKLLWKCDHISVILLVKAGYSLPNITKIREREVLLLRYWKYSECFVILSQRWLSLMTYENLTPTPVHWKAVWKDICFILKMLVTSLMNHSDFS